MHRFVALLALTGMTVVPAATAGTAPPHAFGIATAGDAASRPGIARVNVIDGEDERGSLLALGPALGLTPQEMARIRKVSGYVGCFLPTPSVGTGALYLTNRQILTAGHIFFAPSGERRSKCFFKNQDEHPIMIDIVTERASFGAIPPKPGSNDDFAIVGLAAPVPDAEPFPVEEAVPVAAGDALIVVTAHPAGMAKEMDKAVPVVQRCRVRRAPISSSRTTFYRTDCDATGSSSGGMHLSRIDGGLVFRGVTVTTGPWRDARFHGAPYDEQAGSVTTALGVDAAILEAGQRLATEPH